MFEKNKVCPFSKFECFQNVKSFFICVKLWALHLAINEKYFKKNYDNPNYYVSLMIFQKYKNMVLWNVHSLRWLLWLCFYPIAIIYINVH
jgi:hypothetical protein